MLEARQNGSVYEENIDSIVEKLHGYIPQKSGKAPAKAAAPKPAAPKAAPAPAPAPQPAAAAPSAGALVLPDISEDDFAELKQACEGNQKLWCIAVKFDENNPMNTVGGIQVFAALKNVGNVLKTVPDFDALYEDQFYENVFYYLATEADGPERRDQCRLRTQAGRFRRSVRGRLCRVRLADACVERRGSIRDAYSRYRHERGTERRDLLSARDGGGFAGRADPGCRGL